MPILLLNEAAILLRAEARPSSLAFMASALFLFETVQPSLTAVADKVKRDRPMNTLIAVNA